MNDIRYALRQLLKHPGFSLVVVLTLALGIGANTAIFSVIDGVLLRPAPFADLDRLTMIWETDRNSGTTREPASVPDYLDFRERTTTYQELAAFTGANAILTPTGGTPVRLAALGVTPEFLPMVGIAPIAGRLFTARDAEPGEPQVILIGAALWERLFDRDPDAVGRTLMLNDEPYTVVGVLPEGADFGTLQMLDAAAYQRSFADRGERTEVSIWVPLRYAPASYPRSTHPIFVLGRLAPGATVASTQDEMTAIAADLEATFPENANRGVNVEPLAHVVFGPVRPALLVLLAAVGLVLLVACANVANLLLARGTGRVREVAVRAALGAGARRLSRQFLVEGILLALIGGAAGVLLAIWGTEVLVTMAPADIPRLADVGVDGRVLAATIAMSLLVGVVFGLVPTLQARRADLQSALKGEARGTVSPGPGGGRLRAGLVVTQLALAVVLVVGAGLLVKSFWQLMSVDPGFRTEGVLKAEFALPRSRYPVDFARWPDFAEIHRFNAELLDRLDGVSGIESAALAGNHPLDAGFTNSFVVVGREAEAADWPEISVRRVTPGYFETVGLGVLDGRALSAADGTSEDAVLVINAAARARFFPDGGAIGQQIAFWGANRTIVGVVADERFHGVTTQAPLAVYLPLAQAPPVDGAVTLLARVAGNPLTASAAVERAIRDVDPGLAVFGVEPLDDTLARSLAQHRFTMLLLGLFATLAIALAVLGVHGVLSYMVARRRPEMGIRMALGASRADVVGLVMGEGVRLTVIGLALGVAGALAATRLIRTLLFGVSTTDPLVYAAVFIAVGGVALLASCIPAWRATRVDPMEALRYE